MCLFVLALASQVFAASPDVVISGVYGGNGTAYNADYVELFNRGTNSVDLSTWSIQYASSTGTSWTNKLNLSGTIAPGQYVLVRTTTEGAVGAALPVPPDITGTTPNMSGTNGKLALMRTQIVITSGIGCPMTDGSVSANVADFVGYGSANCFEGAAAAPVLSGTTALVRAAGGCTDTDANSTDFTAVSALAVALHNRSSALAPCGGTPTNPIGVGTATPSSVDRGSDVTLTVTVTGGTAPYSVVADLTVIGGAANTPLVAEADGTTFTLAYSVPGDTVAGVKSITFTVTDASSNTGTGTISLTVTIPPVTATIPEIQGSGPVSPLKDQVVTTTGIVTAKRGNSFYIQSDTPDGDSATSEGLYVYSTQAWADAVVGNKVTVQGTVSEYYDLTEVSPTSVTIVSSGNTLPQPVVLTAATNFTQLERYEGMRVSGDFVAVAPTEANITESTAVSTTNGRFWSVVLGVNRPFREPGIEPGATLTLPAGIPRFDGNPELIKVETGVLTGTTKLSLGTGAVLSGATGVLDYSFGAYTLLPETDVTPTNGGGTVPLRARAENEFTIGTWNLLHFYDTVAPNTTVTAAAYALRLNKASMAVRNVLRMPDILAVQEVENIDVLTALANKINDDAADNGQGNPGYVPYLEEGNDMGGIDVGFLVRGDRVTVKAVTQMYKDLTITHPGGNVYELFDRPPLVLDAAIKQGTQEFPVNVVSLHLRSLNGTNEVGNSGDFARAKRKVGAEKVAELLQDLQGNNANVVALGDFNAYEFSDGYVDVTGTVIGAPAEVAYLTTSDLVDPNFINLNTTVTAQSRYSYTYGGNAQTLDHIVASASLLNRPAEMIFARLNADFPESLYGDGTVPQRVSDHDPAVAYFTLAPTPMTAVAAATPQALTAGESTLLTVNVAPGGFPVSSGIAVTSDLAALSGSATATMYDDGTNGDVAAGDNIFSLTVVVPDVTATSSQVISFAVSDAQSRTATASVTLDVTAIPSTQPTIAVTATPATVVIGSTTLIAATVTPGQYPVSSNIDVVADLTPIGGGANVALYDDATHGDVTAGDKVYSFAATVATSTAPGMKTIGVSMADGQGRTATSSTKITVPQPDFTVAATSNTVTVAKGATASYSLSATSSNGFTGTVTFTCTGAPAKSTCTVTPTTADVAPNAPKTVTVTVATQADKTTAASGATGAWMLGMVLLGGVVVISTRGKTVRSAGAALVLVFALAMSACGDGSKPPKQVVEGTAKGTYTLTVTATSGTTSHATSLTLNVQ